MPNSTKPRRHPALANTPPGVWCPDAVGKVPGYARTAEAHARRCETLKANSDQARAAGRTRRIGVPNGWAGKREEVDTLRREAADKAWSCIGALYRNSLYDDERLAADRLDDVRGAGAVAAKTDAERWAVAASYMIEVILSPTYGAAFRTQAARALLPYVRPKPTQGRTVNRLSEALSFLDGLSADARLAK